MGAFLDKPKTDKYNQAGSGNGLRYGLASMQGWRMEMEDAHCAVTGLPNKLKDWSFFAVFDGHAGAGVSAHCANNLLDCITQSDEFRIDNLPDDEDAIISNIKTGIHTGFLRLDDRMRNMPEMLSGEDKSGTTAVCTMISSKYIFVANCGDSRALLCRDGQVAFSTTDHKPINPAEKERIQNAGGSVMIQRVNGSLAVSRALGDYEYKNVEGKGPCEQLVSPEPEIFVEQRRGSDEFLVLACDGVWDVMCNSDLAEFVRSRLRLTSNLEEVTNQVIDTCLHKGSRDNMSIVLVTFGGAPAVCQESIAKERELEEALEKRIKELLSERDDMNMPQLMQTLSDESFDNLPPGGGLAAKHPFVRSVYKKIRGDAADDDTLY